MLSDILRVSSFPKDLDIQALTNADKGLHHV